MRTGFEIAVGSRAQRWMATVAMTAFMGWAGAFPATAQEEDAKPALPEIVVSASRIALPAERVGSAVSVVTATEMKRRGQQFVSDVLRDVPGLAVSRTGAPGAQTAIRIRGAEANHTLVVIDGIEVNDQSAGSEYDFARLRTDDIERIEILRGPQSALFGSDAIGGVISITTKRGHDGFSGRADLEGGSFRTGKAGAALRYGTDVFNISGSLSRFRTEGISTASESRGNAEADGYTNDTFSLNMGVTPVEWFGADATLRATRAYFETDAFAGGTGANDNASDTTTRQNYARLGIDIDPFQGLWTHRFEAAYTSDMDKNRTNGVQSSFAVGNKHKYGYQTTLSFDTPEFAGAEHTVTLLAESEKDRMKASFLGQGEISIRNEGFAGEYNLGLFEALFLSASLRRDQNDRFNDETTHRVTAAYLIDAWNTRLHASRGTGVKNPTLTELFGFANNLVGNPDLKPEYVTGWDAGIEQRVWNDRATIDVTYFSNDIEDLIAGSGNTAVNLTGVSETRGVEIGADIALTDRLDLSASYTWTNAKTSDGTEQVRRPTNLASLNLNYRFMDDRANLNLGVEFNGSFTDFEFDTAFNRTIVDMGSYTLVNLAGSFEVADGVELYARGENLLNEKYEEVLTFGTPGIAIYAGVRASF